MTHKIPDLTTNQLTQRHQFSIARLMFIMALIGFLIAAGIGQMGTIVQNALADMAIAVLATALLALFPVLFCPKEKPSPNFRWYLSPPWTTAATVGITLVIWVVAVDWQPNKEHWKIGLLVPGKIALYGIAIAAMGHAFTRMYRSVKQTAVTVVIWSGAAVSCLLLLLALRGSVIQDLHNAKFFPQLPRPENADQWPSYSAGLQKRYDTWEIPFAEFLIAAILCGTNGLIGYWLGDNRRRAILIALPWSVSFVLPVCMTMQLVGEEFGPGQHVGICAGAVAFESFLFVSPQKATVPIVASVLAFVVCSSELAVYVASWKNDRSKRELGETSDAQLSDFS